LVTLSFHGNQRSSTQCLDLQLRQNIDPWHPLVVN